MDDGYKVSNTFLLFVYGTLKRDGPRAAVLAGQRFLGQYSTEPGYALYDLGPYPGVVRQPGAGSVQGELFAVARTLQPELDRVEGAPEYYCLEEVRLAGRGEPVFTYLYRRDVHGREQIPDGYWDNRRAAPWTGGAPDGA